MNALTQPGCGSDQPCKAHAADLETIIRAAKNDRLVLLECKLKSTGEKVAVVCAVQTLDDGYVGFVPFAIMPNGNPYEMLRPPNPDGGFYDDDPPSPSSN